MTFLVAYTYSKAIDDSSGFDDWVNFTNYRLSRSLSAYDVTHNFVASYNWAIPFDRAFGGLPKRLTQGWNVNGNHPLLDWLSDFLSQSGGINHSTATGPRTCPTGSGRLSPRIPAIPALMAPIRTSCRAHLLPARWGRSETANRRFFHGPGLDNTDFGMSKRIPIHESMAVELRGEFFNIFNHTQFNNPNGNFHSSLFGVVTSANAPRIGQVSAKFYLVGVLGRTGTQPVLPLHEPISSI